MHQRDQALSHQVYAELRRCTVNQSKGPNKYVKANCEKIDSINEEKKGKEEAMELDYTS